MWICVSVLLIIYVQLSHTARLKLRRNVLVVVEPLQWCCQSLASCSASSSSSSSSSLGLWDCWLLPMSPHKSVALSSDWILLQRSGTKRCVNGSLLLLSSTIGLILNFPWVWVRVEIRPTKIETCLKYYFWHFHSTFNLQPENLLSISTFVTVLHSSLLVLQ